VVANARRANEQPDSTGSSLARAITRDISAADSIPQLEDVARDWGGNFTFIHTAAALVKLAKLPGSRSAAAHPLQRWLDSKWRELLPEAGERELANVLWAWARIGQPDQQLWADTLAAFMQMAASSSAADPAGLAQGTSNTLWACAKLRRPPTAEQADVLLQAMVQPAVLAATKPQAVANAVWALSELVMRNRVAVSPAALQQLLGQEQLRMLALVGTAQAVANTLLALARLATAPAPLLSVSDGQQRAQQLLDGAQQRGLDAWNSQHLANGL
jgi:hypothetical protein